VFAKEKKKINRYLDCQSIMDTRPCHHKYLNAPPLTTPEEPSHRKNHYFNILYTKINGKHAEDTEQ
jgi:hypothetical protein